MRHETSSKTSGSCIHSYPYEAETMKAKGQLRKWLLTSLLLALASSPTLSMPGIQKIRRTANREDLRVKPQKTHPELLIRGGGTTTPVDELLRSVDLFGTAIFAFSGALTAGKKGMDLLGMIIIATITSVGGGTVRDLLIDSGTVFWMRQPLYFEICISIAVLTFLVWPTLEHRFGWKDSNKAICIADALGLGAFAVLGTQTAADHALKPILWPVIGVMTATFGGVTRDVLCQQKPRIMYPNRTMYGAPPLLGSCVYAMLTTRCGWGQQTAALTSFLLTCSARMLSFDRPVRLPYWKKGQLAMSET